MAIFTDDFNRANSSDLGAGWVEVSGDWAIASNRLSPGAAGGTIIARVATAMDTSNNYAQMTVAAAGAVSHGVVCRGNANFSNGYLWRNDGTSWDLFSIVGGSFTNLGTFAGASAPGDVARVSADGTTISGLVNGVVRVSVTNSHVATGTAVGVRSESSALVAFDDFTGSDVGATVTGEALMDLGGITMTAEGVRTVSGEALLALGGIEMSASGSVQTVVPVGSWGPLLSMQHEQALYEQEKRTSPPEDCPYCGAGVEEGPGGVLFCSFLPHFEWPRDRTF